MLRFFRNIRQKLIENGNLRKYFWYAVGEVFLVVIGILIALQINNWNEERKERQEEIVVLNQIKISFESNLKQLEQKIEIRENQLNAHLSIFNMIDDPSMREVTAFDSLLTTTITYTTFDPYNNDFSNTENLKIIKNDSLKRYLSSWTSDFVQVTEEEQNWKAHRELFYIPFIIEHYQLRTARNQSYRRDYVRTFLIDKNDTISQDIGISKHKVDIHQILNHPDFEDHISRAHNIIRITNLQSEILKERIVEILELLQKEINK